MSFPKTHQRLIQIVLMVLLCSANPISTGLAFGVGQVAISIDDTAFPEVTIHLDIIGADGQPITDLKPEEIELYEGEFSIRIYDSPKENLEPGMGVLASAERQLRIGVVIDSIGALPHASRLVEAPKLATWLLDSENGYLSPDPNNPDKVAIFAFNEAQQFLTPVEFTHDHNKVIDQYLSKVNVKQGQDAELISLLRFAIEETTKQSDEHRPILLVFSEGANNVDQDEVEELIARAKDADLLIYTVGLGSNVTPADILRKLAHETGGQYFWYQPAQPTATEEMKQFLDQLVAQRHAGYTLRYQSPCTGETVRVKISRGEESQEVVEMLTYQAPPPRVTYIENVQDGQVLSDTVTITPIIDGKCPVARVEFQLDGKTMNGIPTESPWAFNWNPQDYVSEVERHVLTIIIQDVRGQSDKVNRIIYLPGLPSAPTSTMATPSFSPPSPTPSTISPHVISISLSQREIALFGIAAFLILLLILAISQISFLRGRLVASQARLYAPSTPPRNIDDGETEPMPLESDISLPPEKLPDAYLIVLDSPQKDHVLDIDRPIVRLGRATDQADIIIDWDKRLSRLQAQIEYRDGHFYIWDFSRHGTFVNGERLTRSDSKNLLLDQAKRLEDGAEIKMGEKVRLAFHYKYIPPTDPINPNE